MELVVFELGIPGDFGMPEQIQLPIKPEKDLNVFAFRPHLYVEDTPAGSVLLQIQDENGNKIKDSETLTIASIAQGSTYRHGFFRFLVDVQLKKDVTYNIALRSTGYTFAVGSFIAWCNGFDLGRGNENYVNSIGVNAALGLEVWTNRQFVREEPS